MWSLSRFSDHQTSKTGVFHSPVKLNFDLEKISKEFILMAYDSIWLSTYTKIYYGEHISKSQKIPIPFPEFNINDRKIKKVNSSESTVEQHLKNSLKSNWWKDINVLLIQHSRLHLLTTIFKYDFSTNKAENKCDTSFW